MVIFRWEKLEKILKLWSKCKYLGVKMNFWKLKLSYCGILNKFWVNFGILKSSKSLHSESDTWHRRSFFFPFFFFLSSCSFSLFPPVSPLLLTALANHSHRSFLGLDVPAEPVQTAAKPQQLASQWLRWGGGVGKFGRKLPTSKLRLPASFGGGSESQTTYLSSSFKMVSLFLDESDWIVGTHFHANGNFANWSKPNRVTISNLYSWQKILSNDI